MAELADALDLGSSGRPCRFESCYPQEKRDFKDMKALRSLFIHMSLIEELLPCFNGTDRFCHEKLPLDVPEAVPAD